NEANALRPLSIVDVSNLHVMLYTGDLASAAPKASIKKGVHISGANTDYEYFTSEAANAIIYVGQDAKLTATAVGKAALTINSQGGQAIIVNYGTITGTGDFGGLAVDPGQVNGQLVNYGTITGGVKNKAGELVLVDPNETVDFSTTLGTLAITRFDTPRFLIAGVPYELEAVTTGQATNYAWYANGAKAGSAIKSDPITFPAPGNHNVTLYAKNAKQMVTKTATIKVRQPTHTLTFEKGATGGNGTVYYAGPGTAGGEASPGNIGGYPFAYFRFYDPAANPVIPSATKPTISFPLIGPGDDVPFNTIWVVFKEHVWQFDRYDQNFFPIASQLEQVKKVLVAEAAGKKVSMILEGE
ncbi:PKD domain-containing protein, partial [Thalassospira alkalitolerans]|uniref:PKD domain-containing protein n=1 Tax=Thalassospira alkalitolerans TaxID=1293890 RepID=UPI003AA95FF8